MARNDKPIYQLGEIIKVDANKFIPKTPQIYMSLNIIFQNLKNRFHSDHLILITRGFEISDQNTIDNFIKNNSFIEKYKHLRKPVGRRADGHAYRVYMIDNDIQNLIAIKRIIQQEHFEIIGVAKTGTDAVRFLSRNSRFVDIVLTEFHLVDCSGIDLIKNIRSISRDLKIMLQTKNVNGDELKKAAEFGIHGVVFKPFSKDQFLSKLENVLNFVHQGK